MEIDPEEYGAAEHRLDVKELNIETQRATGYIAKYLSKNIDGQFIDEDEHGNPGVTSAERVKAWASVWGIHQFQCIGLPYITIWRELRRASPKDVEDTDPELAGAHESANDANWHGFIHVMGGVCVKRAAQALKILREEKRDSDSISERVIGVLCQGIRLVTRTKHWVLVRVNSVSGSVIWKTWNSL